MFRVKKWEWKHTISMKVPLFIILVLIGLIPLVAESGGKRNCAYS